MSEDQKNAKSLWLMYKNAKNLLPYRARMENLTWRMMHITLNSKPLDTAFQDYLATPLFSHLGVDKKFPPSSPPHMNEDFDYVAHIRKLGTEDLPKEHRFTTDPSPMNSSSPTSSNSNAPASNSSHSRKRPAPFLPMVVAEPNPVSFGESLLGFDRKAESSHSTVLHLNLSAGLRDQQQNPPSDHGYVFSLDPLAFEGPNESFANLNGLSSSISSSLTDTPAARYPPLQSSYPSLASTIMGTLQPSRRPDPSFSTSAPKPIVRSSLSAPYAPQLRHQHSLLLYDPSSLNYPVGPSSILSSSNLHSENSYASVADYFENLRSQTPQNYDSLSRRSSVVDPGALSTHDSLLQRGRNSFADSISSSVPGTVADMSYLDSYSRSRFPVSTSYSASWNDSYFDDNPMASTAATSLSQPSLPRGAPAAKRSTKKPRLNSRADPSSNSTSKGSGSQKNSTSGGTQGSDIECANCHTKNTPLWRRNPQGEPLCNACGLFLKLHGTVRPLSLKTDVVKKRQRGQNSGQGKKNAQQSGSSKASSNASPASNSNDKEVFGDKVKDGDDFFPTPVQKNSNRQRQENRKKQEPHQEIWLRSASAPTNNFMTNFQVGKPVKRESPATTKDGLHPIHELLERRFDWEQQSELPSETENGENGEGKWDWLSMML